MPAGTEVPLQVEIARGPPRTSTFRPYGVKQDISLPSANVRAMAREGYLYIIAVCSHERPVTARITGLPRGISSLEVPCEDRPEGNAIPVENGAVEDAFPWLTEHLYRAKLPEDGPDEGQQRVPE